LDKHNKKPKHLWINQICAFGNNNEYWKSLN
jgi:hypothetical protein